MKETEVTQLVYGRVGIQNLVVWHQVLGCDWLRR